MICHTAREELRMPTVTPVATPALDWDALASRVLAGERVDAEEALAILTTPDDDLLDLLAAAFRIRRRYFGREVQLYYLINAKSGLCPEDCGYCSQSRVSSAPIARYPWLDRETLMAGARRAADWKACTYCIVASGRGPTDRELDRVVDVIHEIKETLPLRICCCFGILSEG